MFKLLIQVGILLISYIPIYSLDTQVPLDIRNEYLPGLIFLQPSPVSPKTLDKEKEAFHLNINLTNDTMASSSYPAYKRYYSEKALVFNYLSDLNLDPLRHQLLTEYVQYGHFEAQYKTVIDVEYQHIRTGYNYGIGNHIELGLELNIISLNSGTLDHSINQYHSMIGTFTGKETFPNNHFTYSMSDDRKIYLSSKTGTYPGDTNLSFKWNLFEDTTSSFQYSLIASVKLPTGNTKQSMGSGKVDASAGMVFAYKSKNFNHFVNSSLVYISNPFKNSKISTSHYGILSYSVLYQWTNNFGILGQFDFHSSMYHSHTVFLNQPSLMFSTGFNWKLLDTGLLQLGFSEDITYPVPDISFFLNYKTNF